LLLVDMISEDKDIASVFIDKLKKNEGVSNFSIRDAIPRMAVSGLRIYNGEFEFDDLSFNYIYSETKIIDLAKLSVQFQYDGVDVPSGDNNLIYHLLNDFNSENIGVKVVLMELDLNGKSLSIEFNAEIMGSNFKENFNFDLNPSLNVLSGSVLRFSKLLDKYNIVYLKGE